jgi:signal transduction histidine kinase/HAMP domain-containing protein
MSLQTRLTLWSVLVMALIVGVISAMDLSRDLQRQFEATMERAELIKRFTTMMVLETLKRERTVPYAEAIANDAQLQAEITEILTLTPALIEIAVSDRDGRILAASEPSRLGKQFQEFEEFAPVVNNEGAFEKLRILLWQERKYYQLEEALGVDGEPVLFVRVVVYPRLIREDIMPTIKKDAAVAVGSLLGAVLITWAFSTFAFQPLGRLGQTLDLLAKGEYEPSTAPALPADEIGIITSKVNLLGQQLRGAKYDFSDLRGNFERLLDELEDAVLIFGRDRRLFAASGAVEKFLGRQRGDLLGLSITDIFPPNTTLGLLLAQSAQTGRLIRNRRVPIGQTAGSSPGVSVVMLSVDLVDSKGGGAPGGVLVRLRDPEATRQIGRQLQTADRLSAISKITGGVAHEVKNPLNAINMHVELVKMKLDTGDFDVGQHLDIIGNEIERLNRVVKTFLDFTRPVELNLSEIPLDRLVQEVADLATPQAAAAGIEIVVSQATDDARLNVDVDLVKQALLNIVVNAIEAMKEGGQLTLISSVREDQAEIRINDTGPGIPEQMREKIFSLYFTTKKGGSGIGLAMSYRIVQLHDGSVDFVSEPGIGTTFVLHLPIAV